MVTAPTLVLQGDQRKRLPALLAARGVQGVGGAIASAVSLSLMVNLFTEPGERAKAMGIFGFVAAGGGSLGVVLGGILTEARTQGEDTYVAVGVGLNVTPTSGDAVADGLIASFAQPGGNVTGLSLFTRELSGKRLEVLESAAGAGKSYTVGALVENPPHQLCGDGEKVGTVLPAHLLSVN